MAAKKKPTVRLVVDLIEACISNAESLFQEASLLFQSGYFARSFYLSRICIEEIGKISMLSVCVQYDAKNKSFWGTFWKKFRDHSFKTYKAAVSELHDDLQFDVDYKAVSEKAKRKHSEKLGALYVGLNENKAWLPSDYFNADKAKMTLDEASKAIEFARRRQAIGAYTMWFQTEVEKFYEQPKVRELQRRLFEGQIDAAQYIKELSKIANGQPNQIARLLVELAGVMAASGTPWGGSS